MPHISRFEMWVSDAAEILGISLKTLHNKLKEYGNASALAGETAR